MTDDPVPPSLERDTVSADHPMLAGHFPGHPIVPGAWLLAWVTAASSRRLAVTRDARAVVGVKRIKFVRPLEPDRTFECTLNPGMKSMRFTLTSDGGVIAEGSLQLQAHDE